MNSQNVKACTNVKRKNDYKSIRPDPVIQESEGKRIRINSEIDIDREVFRKTANEKLILKAVKKGIVLKKKCRPGKEQRLRDAIAKHGYDCELAKKYSQDILNKT